jgi:hypothetical protein
MKNWKKIILVALVLLLIASTLTAALGPGKWVRIKKGQDATVNVGRAGVSLTDSVYTGTINVYRKIDTGALHPPYGFELVEDILGARFYDSNWNKVKTVLGSVYVYFNLNNKQRNAYNQGRLDIYYFDTWKGNWTLCPTFLVDGGFRAGCRINTYGEYGLLYRDP